MICIDCEKKIKSGSLCKGCHAATYCSKCDVKIKALKGLCLECFGMWETIKNLAWKTFIGEVT